MNIQAIKTEVVLPRSIDLIELLDKYLNSFNDKGVLAITSKIVSLCEGRVVPIGSISEEELIKQESQLYIPRHLSRYHNAFSITNHTLAGGAGIDKSNSSGHYILWPSDVQTTANKIRKYLTDRFKVNHAGVIITDSTSFPFRLGIIGVVLAHSGFSAINNYVGTSDLFGREFKASKANVANGLAAAAVTVMGEGSEQTPLALITDLEFVKFQKRDPIAEELSAQQLSIDTDKYELFWKAAPWQKGSKYY
jgi:F420-0:gamma-glutamyl ligase